MGKLRIGMVGAGTGRGQSWMSTLAKLSEPDDLYQFCGFCEPVEAKRRAAADRWGVPGHTGLVELLGEAGPDVILNAMPPDGNVMSVGLAARYGVHILTEIPIAPTLAMADQMIATCAEHGVRLEVCEQVWLWAKEQLKQRILDAGLLGEVRFVRLYYTNKADYHGINGARMLAGSQAVRVLGHTGVAPVAPYLHFTGQTLDTSCWDQAVIELENGTTILFESPPRGRMSARWDLEGSRGQLSGDELFLGNSADFRRYPFIIENTTIAGETVLDHLRVETDPPVVFGNPFSALRAADGDEVARMHLLTAFHRAVTAGGEPAYGAENARHDQEILLAMRESAARGNVWIDLPLRHETALERALHEEFVRRYGHEPSEVEALSRVAFRQGGVRTDVAGWD